MRFKWREGTIDPAELRSLRDLGLAPTSKFSQSKKLLEACDRYLETHDDLNVHKAYIDSTGYTLGRRIHYYRQEYRAGRLPGSLAKQLESRGMVWNFNGELTQVDCDELRQSSGISQAQKVVDLIDTRIVPAARIAEVLGVTGTALSQRVRKYRESGVWPKIRNAWNQEREQQLRELWVTPGITKAQIAKQLGVHPTTVDDRAKKSGLPARTLV